MKIGIVMGVCARHTYTDECLHGARSYSAPSTDVVALFNGEPCDGHDIPDGVCVESYPERLGQEQGIWRRAYDLSLARQWDWCAILHDDMRLAAPGWENEIQSGAERYRVGVAGWYISDEVDQNGDSPHREIGDLGCLVDGCGIVFNVALFRERGCFSTCQHVCGYGDHEAVYYSLSRHHASLHLRSRAIHREGGRPHTRAVCGFGAGDYREVARQWQSALPARVVGSHYISIAGTMVDMRRDPS